MQLVEYVGRLVYPVALVARLPEDLEECFPEAQGAVTHRQPRSMLETPGLQVGQHLQPALLGFVVSVLNGQERLVALFIDADDRQDALPGFICPDSEVHAIDPNIDVALAVQRSARPALLFFLPLRLQAADGPGDSPLACGLNSAARALGSLPWGSP